MLEGAEQENSGMEPYLDRSLFKAPLILELACVFCAQTFVSWSSLTKHVFHHVSAVSAPLYISTLSEVFEDEGKLQIHNYTDRTSQRRSFYRAPSAMELACAFCAKTFSSWYSLTKHVFRHVSAVSAPIYICTQCSEVFEDEVKLQIHKYTGSTSQSRSLFEATPELELACVFCAQTFVSRWSLTKHVFCHVLAVSAPLYICTQCSVVFDDEVKLQKHNYTSRTSQSRQRDCTTHSYNDQQPNFASEFQKRRLEVQPTTNRCTNSQLPNSGECCGKSLTKYCTLRQYKSNHRSKCPLSFDICDNSFIPPFFCQICGKLFTQSGRLKTHQRFHSGECPISRNIYGKLFTQTGNLKNLHSGERSFSCDICGISFTKSVTLKSHQRFHSGECLFSCGICGKSFTRPGTLKRHQGIHSGDRPFSCNICGKSFTQSGDLKRHQRIHSGERTFYCDTCGKSFIESRDLKKHQRFHSGERPFSCDICGKTFTESVTLRFHKRFHSGDCPFSCGICGKSFAMPGTLKRHQGIHSGERPFSCNTCGKSFTQSGDLKKHQRIHSGERPFSCDICGKSFIESGNLKRHQRFHSGERPFCCDICDKSFTESGHLKKHQRVHSGERPFL